MVAVNINQVKNNLFKQTEIKIFNVSSNLIWSDKTDIIWLQLPSTKISFFNGFYWKINMSTLIYGKHSINNSGLNVMHVCISNRNLKGSMNNKTWKIQYKLYAINSKCVSVKILRNKVNLSHHNLNFAEVLTLYVSALFKWASWQIVASRHRWAPHIERLIDSGHQDL